jgi:hypothetical protein
MKTKCMFRREVRDLIYYYENCKGFELKTKASLPQLDVLKGYGKIVLIAEGEKTITITEVGSWNLHKVVSRK